MRKRLLVAALSVVMALGLSSAFQPKPAVAAEEYIPITEEYFEDPFFRTYISDKFDGNDGTAKDGKLSVAERNKAYSVNIDLYSKGYYEAYRGIKSVKGIDKFPNLEVVFLRQTGVTTVDLSSNKKLREITVQWGNLDSIKLPKTSTVTSVNVSLNNLTTLNYADCPNIEVLNVKRNNFTKLDFSKLPKLSSIDCSENKLTTASVSYCPNLEYFVGNECSFKSLDFSKNPKLEFLECNRNGLTSLNIAPCTLLRRVECDFNKLTSIDVSKLTQLEFFSIRFNGLKTLNISNNPKLYLLDCQSNNISTIDMTKNDLLDEVYVSATQKVIANKNFSKQDIYVSTVAGRSTQLVFNGNSSYEPKLLNANDKSVAYFSGNTLKAKNYGYVETSFGSVYSDFKDNAYQPYSTCYNYKYYYLPINALASNGITKGYSDGTFGVGNKSTRRDVAIFLWRAKGRPDAEKSAKEYFSDLSSYSDTSDTCKAIAWAYENGIIKGYTENGKTVFKPTATVVRKDVLIMIYRYFGKPNYGAEVKFPDCKSYSKTSDTYKAISFAVAIGVTNGYADGNFKPNENCLREQIATFLFRANIY